MSESILLLFSSASSVSSSSTTSFLIVVLLFFCSASFFFFLFHAFPFLLWGLGSAHKESRCDVCTGSFHDVHLGFVCVCGFCVVAFVVFLRGNTCPK